MPAQARAAFCGFTDPDQPAYETLQDIPTNADGQVSFKAFTGGWGILLMLVNHQVLLCKQTLWKLQGTAVTSDRVRHECKFVANQPAAFHNARFMQGVSPLACALRAGAVGWHQMLTVTKEGQLYASSLPHVQAPLNGVQEGLSALGSYWQHMTHFKLCVLEVAAGEEHRYGTLLCQKS